MYAHVEKPKANTASVNRQKSRAVSNFVAQKKSNGKQSFGFVDYGPEAIVKQKMQSEVQYSSSLQIQKKENNIGLPDDFTSGIANQGVKCRFP